MLLNVVFLDVDGVLNHDGCKERFQGMYGVEDDLAEKLACIVHSVGAQIVLVSSWKTFWDEPQPHGQLHPMAKYLIQKLSKQGLHIADRTVDRPPERGKGINRWIRHVSASNIDNWIVLDDEVFPDYKDEGILPHLVKTSFCTGLTDENVDRAISILNGKR